MDRVPGYEGGDLDQDCSVYHHEENADHHPEVCALENLPSVEEVMACSSVNSTVQKSILQEGCRL